MIRHHAPRDEPSAPHSANLTKALHDNKLPDSGLAGMR
jgi:hypothetical protein